MSREHCWPAGAPPPGAGAVLRFDGAPERERRLLAELEAGRLREAMVRAVLPLEAMLAAGDCEPGAMTICNEVKTAIVEGVVAVRSAISHSPPSLAELRELVAAVIESVGDHGYRGSSDRLRAARAAVLTAHPCLAPEPR